jgi:hypothetical protein
VTELNRACVDEKALDLLRHGHLLTWAVDPDHSVVTFYIPEDDDYDDYPTHIASCQVKLHRLPRPVQRDGLT